MQRAIGIIVFPGFQILDAAGPLAVFETPRGAGDLASYRLEILSTDGGPVRSSSGASVLTTAFGGQTFDTLLVVGGYDATTVTACPDTLSFIRNVESRRFGSICTGAFLLAEAGLLDGRRATTHWRCAHDLRRLYPRIRVQEDAIFVRDGPVWTSAGVSAGIDLALAMVEDDLGEAASRRVAQELVVFHRRPGGQSQHSALLDLAPKTDRIGRALAFARSHLVEPLPVSQLADAAGMSARQFARLFVQETGRTPAKAVEQLRVEAARIEIEARHRSLDEIARMTGFTDTDRMRSAFVRAYGQPPQALRRNAA